MTFSSMSAESQDLQKVADAFDAAWLACAEEIAPLERSAAKERLGYIVMQLWQSDPSAELSSKAIELFNGGVAHAAIPFAGADDLKQSPEQ